MNNYIQIYKNVISDKYCDELITKFEDDTNKDNNQGMSFTQVNLNKSQWQDDISSIIYSQNIYNNIKMIVLSQVRCGEKEMCNENKVKEISSKWQTIVLTSC